MTATRDDRSAPGAEAATPVSATASSLLTFSLGQEEYGLDLQRVREIRTYGGITPIPNAPEAVEGVTNLRGDIVPIVDVRARLGLPPARRDRFTVMVIVETGRRLAGLVVDAVSDVVEIDPDTLTHAPELGTDVDTTFLTSIARRDEQLVLVLDIDRLVAVEEIAAALETDSNT